MGSGDKDEESRTSGCKKKVMDLKECIQDSPSFRIQLKEREKEIADLEARLEKVVTECDRMVSSGILYTDASRAFSVSVKDLAAHFKEDEVIHGTLIRFYEILKELQSYYSILFDQAQRSVQSSLRDFLSGELRKVKDTKKVFHRVSDDLSSCTIRNATIPRNKIQECEEASSQLASAKNKFSHHALDYGYQINAISCVKGHEILSNLLSYMRAQFTFFHQGYDLLHEFDPFMRQVGTQVDLFRKEANESIKEMDSRHSLVTSHHLQNGSPDTLHIGNPTLAIETSGYLFKKPRGNKLFKTWSRRWFILGDNKLVYQSESKDEDCSVVAEDMRMCTVKLLDELDRRFCFEVVTPWRSCTVQADSETLRKKWVTYIEASIARALRISASGKKIEEDDDFQRRSMMVVDSNKEPIHVLHSSPGDRDKKDSFSMGFTFLSVPGNDKCADCDGENPTWASINLGIMLCIECSGIHRSLGVHISKVRSVTLDDWEPDLQKIMCQLGNARVNGIYEYDIPSHVKKPTAESSRTARETFIRLKYAQHAFVHPHPNFERHEIPLPAPNFSELLMPSKSPHALHGTGGGSSPKSPTRRSFSPSLKLRSPRLHKNPFMSLRTSSRPSSASSVTNPSDQSTPADSEEDLRRIGLSQSQSGTMNVLAENLKKLEKSGKLKSWGGSNQSLSDKIRSSARRSSKRISSYAKAKISGARDKLHVKSKEKPALNLEVHSDDEDMATTSTPLLYSMSASTQNLSSSYIGPPPKPPRTFATKRLSGISASDDESELFKSNDDFSDILSAIKEMGILCKSSSYGGENDSDSGLPNGRIVDSSTIKMKKSESSPQLSHGKTESSSVKANGNPPRLLTPLNTIDEDQTTKQETSTEISTTHLAASEETVPNHLEEVNSSQLAPSEEIDSNHLAVSLTSVDLPPGVDEASLNDSDIVTEELKVSSVPLRRKRILGPSASFDSSLANSVLTSSDGDIPSSVQAADLSHSSSNRFSILSTTSADFFSADSSDGSDSKFPSISVSPDIPSHLPVTTNTLRAPSRSSIEDECFSTPPSTPTFPDSKRSTMDRENPTNQIEEVDHVSKTVNKAETVNDGDKLTNQNESQDQVTADSATITTAPPKISVSLSPPAKRKRSVTVSDSLPPFRTLPHVRVTRSKDDNFQTEYKGKSNELVTSPVASFSQQDLLDILGKRPPVKSDPPVEQAPTIPEEVEEERETSSEEVSRGGSRGQDEISDDSPVPCGESPEGVEIAVIPDSVTPDEFLGSSVLACNLPGILCALAHGAKINSVAATSPEGDPVAVSSSEGDKAPILLAIDSGNSELTEYLFQNGAKLNCTDSQGRGCLHYAIMTNQPNLVVSLLKRGVKPEAKDCDGKNAIQYAVERENGDIVTMLRMAKFRENADQGSDDRQCQYMEELQSEFYRDFEVAAIVDPDRLRKSTSDSSSLASRDS